MFSSNKVIPQNLQQEQYCTIASQYKDNLKQVINEQPQDSVDDREKNARLAKGSLIGILASTVALSFFPIGTIAGTITIVASATIGALALNKAIEYDSRVEQVALFRTSEYFGISSDKDNLNKIKKIVGAVSKAKHEVASVKLIKDCDDLLPSMNFAVETDDIELNELPSENEKKQVNDTKNTAIKESTASRLDYKSKPISHTL